MAERGVRSRLAFTRPTAPTLLWPDQSAGPGAYGPGRLGALAILDGTCDR